MLIDTLIQKIEKKKLFSKLFYVSYEDKIIIVITRTFIYLYELFLPYIIMINIILVNILKSYIILIKTIIFLTYR